jgi:hypothetical protein
MAKPMIVTLPVLLLLLDAGPLGRVQALRRDLPRLLVEKLPFLALAAAGSVTTLAAQSAGLAVQSLEKFPLSVRLANVPLALAGYLRTFAWPLGLSTYYPHPGAQLPWAAAGLAAGALVAASVVALRSRCGALRIGWPWFLLSLLPVIGVVQVGEQARADRFTYLPSAGLAIGLAWGAAAAARALPRRAVAAAALCTLAALGALSHRQARVWRDGEHLFRHAADVTRDNWLSRGHLGRQDEAAAQLEEAYRIQPDFLETVRGLARLRLRQGRHAEAAALDARIVANLPRDPGARHALGSDLEALGRAAEALREYGEAARLDPHFAAPRVAVGRILLAGGRREEACAWFTEALRAEPGDPEALRQRSAACR